jgi:hypothetical protein
VGGVGAYHRSRTRRPGAGSVQVWQGKLRTHVKPRQELVDCGLVAGQKLRRRHIWCMSDSAVDIAANAK